MYYTRISTHIFLHTHTHTHTHTQNFLADFLTIIVRMLWEIYIVIVKSCGPISEQREGSTL